MRIHTHSGASPYRYIRAPRSPTARVDEFPTLEAYVARAELDAA